MRFIVIILRDWKFSATIETSNFASLFKMWNFWIKKMLNFQWRYFILFARIIYIYIYKKIDYVRQVVWLLIMIRLWRKINRLIKKILLMDRWTLSNWIKYSNFLYKGKNFFLKNFNNEIQSFFFFFLFHF